MVEFSKTDVERLLSERNVWFTTVNPFGKPHLIPLWYVFVSNKFYMCTQDNSVKIRNLRQNRSVAVALEDGFHAFICEGTAKLFSPPFDHKVSDAFISKYDWNIKENKSYNVVIEVTPQKLLKFNDNR